MSRIQASLESNQQAQESVDQALALLTEATSDEVSADRLAIIAFIEAQTVRTILNAAKNSPQENIDAFHQLYLECQALEPNQLDTRYAEVRAELASELGAWYARQDKTASELLSPSQTCISLYQEAVALLQAASQQDERLRWKLTTAAAKLSDALAGAERYPEAVAALQLAIVQQQQLLQELPESDRFRLILLTLLDRQFQLAFAQKDVAGEMASANIFLNQAETLHRSDPARYPRELRRGYILTSHAYRDSSQEELAIEFMVKATEQARQLTGDNSQTADRLLLADLLKQQAELLISRVNRRSIVSQNFSALQASLSLLEESLAIYEELEEATTTELGSPYWLTIELKHRLEDELDSFKRNNQESSTFSK